MDDFLMHHGILGQKWGIRRFQNEDGTYTELGKKRKRESMTDEELRSAIRRTQLERRYAEAKTRPSKVKSVFRTGAQAIKTAGKVAGLVGEVSSPPEEGMTKAEKKERDKKRSNLKTASDQLSKAGEAGGNLVGMVNVRKRYDLSNYSDAELEKLVKRAELEKQYDTAVSDKSFQSGLDTANGILSAVGSTLTIATASIVLYNMIKKK